jgi:hypothetical protein
MRRFYFVPRISLRAHILLLFFACLVAVTSIALSVKGPAHIEAMYAFFVVWLMMFVYYFVMIYHGIRYDNGLAQWKWNGMTKEDMLEALAHSGIDIGKISIPDFDLGDNVFAAILAFLVTMMVSIIVLFAMVILAWAGVNLLGYSFILVWIPLYSLIKYGVRRALINVVYAQGKLLTSLMIAAFHGCIAGFSMGCVTFFTEILLRELVG